MWIITGTLLLITDWRKKTRLGLRRFGILAAILVGFAQAAAIMPGISRSGATICVAILIGLRRRWAVEFSFLIAIPAILGATVVQLARDFGEIGSATLAVSSVLAGSATAALVGILALRLLIKASRTANLKFFAFYCYILACFVLVYLLSNP
jgi:undecaprenyl-diphosphatase